MRIEDIDRERCRPEFEEAALRDLRWMGLQWDEGPDRGGPVGPYRQSERLERHRALWRELVSGGHVYPADFSRSEILSEGPARERDGGVLFPVSLRAVSEMGDTGDPDATVNWRFRVPDGETIRFLDGNLGYQEFVAGRDFGDFLVWRKAGGPSYELAVVADDIDMEISEVVRGEDLLVSTARQLLLYRALSKEPPDFRHEALVRDASGKRLSKTAQSVSIEELRGQGYSPDDVLNWGS